MGRLPPLTLLCSLAAVAALWWNLSNFWAIVEASKRTPVYRAPRTGPLSALRQSEEREREEREREREGEREREKQGEREREREREGGRERGEREGAGEREGRDSAAAGGAGAPSKGATFPLSEGVEGPEETLEKGEVLVEEGGERRGEENEDGAAALSEGIGDVEALAAEEGEVREGAGLGEERGDEGGRDGRLEGGQDSGGAMEGVAEGGVEGNGIVEDGDEDVITPIDGEAAHQEGGTTVDSVADAVETVAIGSINAAAAALARVSDQLRSAAGNAGCKPQLHDFKLIDGSLMSPRPLNWAVPPDAAAWPAGCHGREPAVEVMGSLPPQLCEAAVRAAHHRELILCFAAGDADGSQVAALAESLAQVGAVGQLLVASTSTTVLERARAAGAGGAYLMRVADSPASTTSAPSPVTALAPKYAVLAKLLAAGFAVLVADIGTTWRDAPFAYLHR